MRITSSTRVWSLVLLWIGKAAPRELRQCQESSCVEAEGIQQPTITTWRRSAVQEVL